MRSTFFSRAFLVMTKAAWESPRRSSSASSPKLENKVPAMALHLQYPQEREELKRVFRQKSKHNFSGLHPKAFQCVCDTVAFLVQFPEAVISPAVTAFDPAESHLIAATFFTMAGANVIGYVILTPEVK
jgi:hypothetical protein